jgi:hypothetical protein
MATSRRLHDAHEASAKKKKIGLCICEEDKLFVWFNTAPQRHGEGQLKCAHGDHPALTHDCCLDLWRATTFLPHEVANGKPRGPISDALKKENPRDGRSRYPYTRRAVRQADR